MGLFQGLLGNATDVDVQEVEREFANILIENEQISRAFKIVRDLIVFTNKRIVLVDRQGITGKKAEYQSIPYSSISRFSKETTGNFDLDAELKLWVTGQAEPITKKFAKDASIHDVYKVLSHYKLWSV